jgi:hypothetical protein
MPTAAYALDALADRGCFKGREIRACEAIGVTPFVLKPLTSGGKAKGRFGNQDFIYNAQDDTYRCPAGETLTWLHVGGEGRQLAPLLDDQVCRLSVEGSMHQQQAATPHQTLGARGGHRRHAGPARSRATGHARAPSDRRASLRHA